MGMMKLNSILRSFCIAVGLISVDGARGETVIPVEISQRNLLMSRQDFAAPRIDKNFDGNQLQIAGKPYDKGVGVHATSMIPITIPESLNGKITVLQGACGIADSANGGSVEFKVMSGSEVLWSSGKMTHGMPAKSFQVPVTLGMKHIYLLADELDNNFNDHACWVDLKWGVNSPAKSKGKKVINAEKYGLQANVLMDQGPALRKAISALRDSGAKVLQIPKGEYHIYSSDALPMSFHASNHDQPAKHAVGIPLVDLRDVTIEGNGAVFVFHGKMIPMLLMDSQNVKVNNLSVDFARAWVTEAKVLSLDDKAVEFSIDEKEYPCVVKDGRLVMVGEDWEGSISCAMAFKKGTKHIAAGTGDIGWNSHVEVTGKKGVYRALWNLKSRGIECGDVLVLRNYSRPHPGCVVYRTKNTIFNNVAIHRSIGMSILVQRSENFSMNGGGVYIRPNTNRVSAGGVDATHFSNVKGKVVVKNALFEGMMDDAINVHATCLSVEEIIDAQTIRCQYKHGQAIGFETFLPGEKLQFIKGPTLEPVDVVEVLTVQKKNSRELIIQVKGHLPTGVAVGDAIENADYHPEVVFINNLVRNNRARGALFTTPKKVLVDGNCFDHSSGSAILLAGDAQGWYESGACRDVTISNNKFINNLTSMYQFTNGIISICPEVRQLQAQKAYYHRNIVIKNNEFVTFDVPLLSAISARNLSFEGNKVTYNSDYPSWNQSPFILNRCADVRIKDNEVSKTWTAKDCRLLNTDASSVQVD